MRGNTSSIMIPYFHCYGLRQDFTTHMDMDNWDLTQNAAIRGISLQSPKSKLVLRSRGIQGMKLLLQNASGLPQRRPATPASTPASGNILITDRLI